MKKLKFQKQVNADEWGENEVIWKHIDNTEN